MKTILKTQLVAAGVSQAKVDAMTVDGFTSTKTVTTGGTTAGTTAGSTGGTTTFETSYSSSAHDLLSVVVPQVVLTLALIFHA
jgi:hypothetical protein